MIWLAAGGVLLLLVGVAAWFYPQLKSRVTAAWRATRYRALAAGLDGLLARGSDADDGFMPTVKSIFGPYGEARNVIRLHVDDETVVLFEYLFGRRPSPWVYKRGVAVVAFRLSQSVPMFTLQRPRGPAQSRTTSFTAGGQRLVVQALGELELWSAERDRQRAKALIGGPLRDELGRDPGWDIRGVDRWLVIFNERKRHAARLSDLEQYLEQAERLRRLLRS